MPICTECGQVHQPEHLELTFRRPDVVAELNANDLEARVQENKDLCVLDGQRFFIRGVLPLPVVGRDRSYNLGVWVEVSRQDFERVYERWDDDDQAAEPAFRAMLANDIPLHSNGTALTALLSLTGPTTRPMVTLEQTEHSLSREQIGGISEHRAAEYSSIFA